MIWCRWLSLYAVVVTPLVMLPTQNSVLIFPFACITIVGTKAPAAVGGIASDCPKRTHLTEAFVLNHSWIVRLFDGSLFSAHINLSVPLKLNAPFRFPFVIAIGNIEVELPSF